MVTINDVDALYADGMAVKLESTHEYVARARSSRSTTSRGVAAGLIPPPIKLGERRVAFVVQEVDLVLKARIAGAADDEVRRLVAAIVERRKAIRGQILGCA